MNILAISLLATISLPVLGDFSTRLRAADSIKKSTDGQNYSAIVDAHFLKAFLSCRRPNTDSKSCPIPFSLVASIDKDGRVTHIAVKPSSPISECFKAYLSKIILPPPPAHLVGSTGFPVSFAIGANITPEKLPPA